MTDLVRLDAAPVYPARRARTVAPRARSGVAIVRREDTALFILAALPLLTAGLWAAVGRGIYHGDALARGYLAVQVIAGHEPTLANLGFAWPPLPTLLQVPFAILMPNLAAQGGTGPIVSTLAAGLCAVLLNRLLAGSGVGPRLRWTLIAGVFAHPLVLALALSGLSEIPSLVFLLLALIAFRHILAGGTPLGWVAVMGAAISLAILCRYEALVVGGVLGGGLVVALSVARAGRGWTYVEAVALAYAAPVAYTLAVFLALNATVGGDPLSFARGPGSTLDFTEAFVPTQPWLAVIRGDPVAAAGFVVRQCWNVSPLVFLAAAAAAAVALWRRDIGLGTLLAVALAFPALQAAMLVAGQSIGSPRYLFTNVVLAPVLLAGAWQGLVLWPAWRRWLAVPASAVMLLASAFGVVAAWTDLDDVRVRTDFRNATGTQHYLLALLDPGAPTYDPIYASEEAMAVDLRDGILADEPNALILIDDTQASHIILATGHPDRFVTQNATDFEEILAAPVGRVGYVLVPDAPLGRNLLLARYPDLGTGSPGFSLVREYWGTFADAGYLYERWLLLRVDAASAPSGALS